MSEINILSPHVADLIAAGEVVDRPASVVKELMENSFDAGARTVTVEIRNGGATYIRVTDDGKGMSPEDAGIAFLRHATSKLQNERGLESIGTFGFRGEALAAVSAVSRIEMTTRKTGADHGVRMTLTAGDIQEMYETGCPEGTTMIIRDLFFNTPARLKFLKSDRAEGSACVQAALKCALGRPDISVRCIKDGKEEFFSPGDGKLESCVYHLLGRDMAKSMIQCEPVDEFVRVRGFVSSPAEGRGNRTAQYFFVNGRAVKSPLIQKGLEMAYRNRLLTGRYPYCVLYVEIPFGSVDVNVHPTKAEVKFSNEKTVYDAVYYTCLEAVNRENRLKEEKEREIYWKKNDDFFNKNGHYPAKIVEPTPEKKIYNPLEGIEYDETGRIIPTADGRELERYDIPLQLKKDFRMRDAAATPDYIPPVKARLPEEDIPPEDIPAVMPPVVQAPIVQEEIALTMEPIVEELEAGEHSSPLQDKVVSNPAPTVGTPLAGVLDTAPSVGTPLAGVLNSEPVQETVWEESPVPVEERCEPFRVVGEVLKTYIVVEHSDKMTLIDKHAAHERMHFDRLSAYKSDAPGQMLLVPEVLRLSREDYDLVSENAEAFEQLGYEIDSFGDDALMLRAVPANIDYADGRASIEELCEHLRSGRGVTYEQVRLELLKTVACKAAIKAGRSSDAKELAVLAEAVLLGKVKYCPHGRPVSVTYTKNDLHKQFDRIV
ncbi:MAG: DNA mismatch repair endonuclease MutL [Oscillospiraceae bacterium]|nr:DNA mismatch repair endonuclease MutL [Oscillospiraceae bacterium]